MYKMPQKSKFQTFFEEEAANIPPKELAAMQSCPHIKALLDSLNPSKKKVTAIQSCDKDAITRILGLDTSRVQSLTHHWELPSDVTKVNPSNWLWKGFGFVDDYWQRNSENSTRTIIDLHLLDALNQINKSREENVKPIASWTEISLSWSTETEELSGRGDHFLGYSQGEYVGQALNTLLLAGEAKALNSERNIWQIVAYCGILHKLRKRRAVSNPNSPMSTIYGFITDSQVWEFVRIDNDGLVETSKVVSDPGEVATWLGYLITVAQASTLSESPAVSLDDLTNFAVKIERFNLRKRRTLEISDDDDVDDTDAAEAFKSAVKKNLEEGKKKARRGSYTEFDV